MENGRMLWSIPTEAYRRCLSAPEETLSIGLPTPAHWDYPVIQGHDESFSAFANQ